MLRFDVFGTLNAARCRLFSSLAHGVEELLIRLGCREFVDEEFHAVHHVHGVQHLAQDPDPVERYLVDKKLLFPGP